MSNSGSQCGCNSPNSNGPGNCGVEVTKTSAAGAAIGGIIGGILGGPPGAVLGAAAGAAAGAEIARNRDHCRPKKCDCDD